MFTQMSIDIKFCLPQNYTWTL